MELNRMANQTIQNRLQTIFEYLHNNPETSWNEVNTTSYIANILKEEGLQPKTFDNMTGLYVDIGKGTPKVGFRTDIDALWQEVDGEFRANHSCGHDGHMTMALGTIFMLKEMESSLPGSVRILFQPAEEKAQGAMAFVKEGIIDSLQFLFGTHVRPLVELQDGNYAPALYHGAAKLFTGKIIGVDAHGARPEQGVNAIEVAASLVDGMKRIWISPTQSASIKMTQITAGGSSTNIIPGNATFSIDARAQNNETMEALTIGFEKVVAAVSTLYGVSIDYKVESHIAAAQVDGEAKAIMKQAIIDVAGEENCAQDVVTPGGEDFHIYTYSKPELQTTMLGLGCGVTPGLHHPKMTFNRERLKTGAEIVTRALMLALQHVERSGKND